MESAPVEFTEWFNRLVIDEDLGNREAARKIGISAPTVAALLHGERPSEGICVKLAIAFNLASDQVLSIAGYRQSIKRDHFIDLIDLLAEQLPNDQEKMDAVEYLRQRLRVTKERSWRGK